MATSSKAASSKPAKTAKASPAKSTKAAKAVAPKVAAAPVKATPRKAPAKTAPKKAAATPKAKVTPEQYRLYVEVAAYHIAERRGFQGGNALEDWAQAEAEIDRLLSEGILKP